MACASQLMPANVGEVRNALREEYPAADRSRVPEFSRASTPGANEDPCTATRP